MSQLRTQYRDRLSHLEDDLLGMGALVLEMLSEVMRALADNDQDRAAAVIRSDDRLDERYTDVQAGILTLLALQAPVASELRLVSAFLHANIHLERMGDLCVNIAKFVQLVELPGEEPELMAQLQEMGSHARRVITRSLEAFTRRDVDLVNTLPELDEPLDQLNKGLFKRLVQTAAGDEQRLDWAVKMVMVARYLERLGDHAVDIGEQVIFAVTGQTVELASNSPVE
ncbi:MAG: phosphate signaling complex protein PhoU [Euzebyales bacterium]|nr:phosphate signaling complex protein PhoU [Euzebyales bacterium]MBA3620966.1 phosphate signaling complex protein PhoU [Euzebyales bacterium]MDQ3430964.1 phosphate signaling complex protein PhoU [Actinomycetota bacterium]